ncbi:MAG TPA: NYN domain-containing protein [Vicinamibacterales bacterium]|nr:NYN domain-containing protein [Vicinamibacterales bacterium]
MNTDERLRIAVFIDFDNIEIGVKNTLGSSFDAGLVLEALKERGEVVSKMAYSDWQRAGGYSRALTQHAIRMVQRNLTPGGDKNGADINLALDALEMAFTHPHINAFVIVGGDSDFISLVEKLKQYDKKIFIVGGRQFTSGILQRNCHEFIAYENLAGAARVRQPGAPPVRFERAPIEQAIPLLARAMKVLSDREGAPPLGLLKTTLLQLDSTFSERTYGAGSFRDFAEKLEKIGALTITQGKGGLYVSAPEGGIPVVESPALPAASEPAGEGGPIVVNGHAAATGGGAGAPAQVGSQADGVKEFGRIIGSGQVRKWPMYLRNVKQIIKQVSGAFDERAYGFSNLVELLRAAQRDGLVRVDRDRHGVIRIFQGSNAPAGALAPAAPSTPATKIFDIEDELAAEAAMAADGRAEEGPLEVAAAASDLGVPVIVPPAAVPPTDEEDEDLSVGPGNDEASAVPPGLRAAVPGRGPRAGRRPRAAATAAPARARAPRGRRK